MVRAFIRRAQALQSTLTPSRCVASGQFVPLSIIIGTCGPFERRPNVSRGWPRSPIRAKAARPADLTLELGEGPPPALSLNKYASARRHHKRGLTSARSGGEGGVTGASRFRRRMKRRWMGDVG